MNCQTCGCPDPRHLYHGRSRGQGPCPDTFHNPHNLPSATRILRLMAATSRLSSELDQEVGRLVSLQRTLRELADDVEMLIHATEDPDVMEAVQDNETVAETLREIESGMAYIGMDDHILDIVARLGKLADGLV